MYNIEERINNWYKTNEKTPIVALDDSVADVSKNNEDDSRKITNGIISKPKTRSELVHNLQNYVKTLTSLNEGRKEELKEYEIKSDEEIENIAETESGKKYETQYANENLKNEINLKELNNKKQNAVKNSNNDVLEIQDYYDGETKNSKNSAIKNGISRSTILDGQIKGLKDSKEKEVKKVKDDLEDSLKYTDSKIEDEQKRHDTVIESIDRSKEEKKNSIIDDLKAKREELLKLGSYVETDFDGQIKKTSNPSKEMLDIYKSVINDCLNYYQSLDKEKAKNEYLNDMEIQNLLGDYEKAIRTYVTGEVQTK